MNKKASFLKTIDRVIGPLAVHLAHLFILPEKDVRQKPESVLFVRPGGIGDAVLLLPAIRQLKMVHPGARIDVLAEKRNCDVFSLCPEVEKVFLYDRLKDLTAAVRGGYDVVIDTEQWYRLSAVAAFMTCAPVRIGFATNVRGRLLSEKIAYDPDEYEAESFLKLLSPIAGDKKFDAVAPFINVSRQKAENARRLLDPVKKPKIAAIFPGGSVKEKIWGMERFRETARRLAEAGYGIAVVGGREDETAGERIADGLPFTVNLCGRSSLEETAAILKEVSLLITGDSGIMHLACGVGTKTLSLFGPGNEKKWAPKEEGSAVIRRMLDCAPCSRFGNTTGCKTGLVCMDLITADEVTAKAIELLER